MSSTSVADAIGRALARRRAAVGVEEFLEVLDEAAGSTEAITAAQRSFLVEDAHLDPALLDPERQVEPRRRMILESVHSDAMALRSGQTTSEVARMLGTSPRQVLRMRARGDLHALKRGREYVFPRWQFKAGQAVPRLRRIIELLPRDIHALDVEAFMTAPQEALDELSIVDWLATGRDPEPAIETVEDLNYA